MGTSIQIQLRTYLLLFNKRKASLKHKKVFVEEKQNLLHLLYPQNRSSLANDSSGLM